MEDPSEGRLTAMEGRKQKICVGTWEGDGFRGIVLLVKVGLQLEEQWKLELLVGTCLPNI